MAATEQLQLSAAEAAVDATSPVDSGVALEPFTVDLDFAYRETLAAVLIGGDVVAGVEEGSVGAGRPTREVRNFSFELPNFRDRLLGNTLNPLQVTLAVGRFLWMVAGSDRLTDIRFYEKDGLKGDSKKGVARFSDDSLAISGSNYGARLFRPRPGIDQVANCIELIRGNPQTRRAAMTIFQPEDAGRGAADIPCTFGVLFSPRSGVLHTTVVMRSNNAWLLLPYNVFEFSLLTELVASETGLDVGEYHHFANSMHIYEEDVEKARQAIGSSSFELEPFPPMPAGSLSEARDLCVWESYIRHRHAGLTKRDVTSELKRLKGRGEFWEPFGRVVLTKALLNAGKADLAQSVAASTLGPLGQLLREELRCGDLTAVPSTYRSPSQDGLRRLHSQHEMGDDHRERGRFWLMVIRDQLAGEPSTGLVGADALVPSSKLTS